MIVHHEHANGQNQERHVWFLDLSICLITIL